MSKDGGPAFPFAADLNLCPTFNVGMSLRDYFAAAALTGLITVMNAENMALYAASNAYELADKMLAEREKSK